MLKMLLNHFLFATVAAVYIGLFIFILLCSTWDDNVEGRNEKKLKRFIYLSTLWPKKSDRDTFGWKWYHGLCGIFFDILYLPFMMVVYFCYMIAVIKDKISLIKLRKTLKNQENK